MSHPHLRLRALLRRPQRLTLWVLLVKSSLYEQTVTGTHGASTTGWGGDEGMGIKSDKHP